MSEQVGFSPEEERELPSDDAREAYRPQNPRDDERRREAERLGLDPETAKWPEIVQANLTAHRSVKPVSEPREPDSSRPHIEPWRPPEDDDEA